MLTEFISLDGREVFFFNITRSSIEVSKCTYQKRARQVEILRRLDIGGSAHSNPEVEAVPLDFIVNYDTRLRHGFGGQVKYRMGREKDNDGEED